MKEIRKLAKEGDSRKGALTILAKDLVGACDVCTYQLAAAVDPWVRFLCFTLCVSLSDVHHAYL